MTYLRKSKQEAQRATYRAPESAIFVDRSERAAIFGFPMDLDKSKFSNGPENTNLVEDAEIWLLVKCLCILCIGFTGVENVSANQRSE